MYKLDYLMRWANASSRRLHNYLVPDERGDHHSAHATHSRGYIENARRSWCAAVLASRCMIIGPEATTWQTYSASTDVKHFYQQRRERLP